MRLGEAETVVRFVHGPLLNVRRRTLYEDYRSLGRTPPAPDTGCDSIGEIHADNVEEEKRNAAKTLVVSVEHAVPAQNQRIVEVDTIIFFPANRGST